MNKRFSQVMTTLAHEDIMFPNVSDEEGKNPPGRLPSRSTPVRKGIEDIRKAKHVISYPDYLIKSAANNHNNAIDVVLEPEEASL